MIRRINELAFGQPEEAHLVDMLRGVVSPFISLVALLDTQVIGNLIFSPVPIESAGSSVAALCLGPMAVHPAHQNQGTGSSMVIEGLRACIATGHRIVVVVGHPIYYPRFGFVRGSLKGLRSEYEVPDEAFMVAELEPGALQGVSGVAKYHPIFNTVQILGGMR